MIELFKVQNTSNLKQMTIGTSTDCDLLIDPNFGVDWGLVDAFHNTYSYPGQTGMTISSTGLNPRVVTVSGYVYYIISKLEKESMTYQDRLKYVNKKIFDKKRLLSDIIDPMEYVRIIIGDYFLEGKPYASVKFGQSENENNAYFCRFQFMLYCANPMFQKVSDVQTILSGSIPKFHFPLVFPKKKGILMGVRQRYQLVPVENVGDVTIGGIITLEAKGTVSNPRIENVLTGEFLKIDKTLHEGEKVIINTTDGPDKGVVGYINEEYIEYLEYWDWEGTWMKFNQGISLIGYSVDSGNAQLLSIKVDLNPAFYNLEEM